MMREGKQVNIYVNLLRNKKGPTLRPVGPFMFYTGEDEKLESYVSVEGEP
jgi:hypothetical protein